jgi:aspartate racemase
MIGILAGMGARSTAPFIDLVITECQRQYGATFDDEYPHMLIYSLPVPFRLDRPLDDAMKVMIQGALVKLQSNDVEFIAMPCNTAHIYYDDLAAGLGVPLLNMIDETLGAIPESARRVTLFATPMTVAAGLYQRGIEQAGREIVMKESWQKRVDELIRAIKHSTDRLLPQRLWDDLVAEVAGDGTDTILLGCTDLNAIVPHVPEGVVLLDATECLAGATVARWAGRRE